MKTIDIIDHFSDLDRVRFEDQDEYVEYFYFIKDAFNKLIDSLRSRTSDNPIEIAILKEFLQKYLNTIELLRSKYVYESDDRMAIDLTDSSFPNYLEIRKLVADGEKSDQFLNGLPPVESLKQEVIDYIFNKKEKPLHLLEKLGRATYYSDLKSKNYLRPFTEGNIFEIGKSKKGDKRYIYNWASYDSMTNRPFIYMMVFEFTNSSINILKEGERVFKDLIKKSNHDSSPLSVIAKDIDDAYDSVKPKVLKRIDIGPIYCKYSKENHEISQLIQNELKDDDFAFFYTTEIVHSVGEKEVKEGSFFNKKSSLRQVFFVDKTDIDSLERNVSEVNRYLIATHSVAQHLNVNLKEYIEKLKVAPITY